MANEYGLDSGGNVVVQQPAVTGDAPATRFTGGKASFTGFTQASSAPQSNFGAVADTSLKTLEALNKLTDGLLRPMIEAEQKKRYFEGMAQVAQGKTLIEVQKEQPWYTRIFGPSATVQGAQAMTLMGAMNQAETQFYHDLPTLASQPPDAARQYLVNQAASIGQTGDPTMDAMVQAKLTEQFGPMMNAHMKQHLKFVQEQNSLAFGNNLMTAGDAYQQKLGQSGFFTPDQLDMEKQRAVDAFTPIPGMTPDAWQKSAAQALTANLMKGNFGIVEAFQGTPEYQQLPLNVRTQLETQVQPYAAQWVQRNLPAFRADAYELAGLELALSQGTGPQSLEALDAWIDQANQHWKVSTGSSEDKFNNNQRAAMVTAFYKGQMFREKQQAVARAHTDKMTAEYQDDAAQQTAAMFAANNNGALPPNHSKIKPENVQSIYRKVREDLMSGGDEAGLDEWLSKLAVVSQNGSKWMDQDLSMQMTTSANNFLQQGMPVSDFMLQNLKYMQVMAQKSNGLAGLANYIGAENAAKMTALINSGVDLSDKDALDLVRTSISRGWGADVSAKDRKVVTQFLNDQDTFLQRNLPIFGSGALAGYDLNDASKQRLGELLAPTAARLVKGNGIAIEDAIPLSFSLMFGNSSKIDYVDGAFTEPNPASSFRSMFAVVSELRDVQSQASEDYQAALTKTIDDAMSTAIGKVPISIDRDLSTVDRLGNTVARTTNNLLESIPFVGEGNRPMDETGYMQGHPDKFDPAEYVTASAVPVGDGILQVQRVPRSPSPSMRPVTVTITAQQVAETLDGVYRDRVAHQKQVQDHINQMSPSIPSQFQ